MSDVGDNSTIPIQNLLVMEHLRHAPITPREALSRYGCFRLAARIFDLRQDGHEIVTIRVVNDWGNPFAEYHLLREARPRRNP